MNKRIITNVSKILLILFIFQFTGPVIADTVKLTSGTPIQLSLFHTINGKTSRIGKRVTFRLLNDINVDGNVVVSAGTKAFGEVVEIVKPGFFGKPGTLSIDVKSIQAVDGSDVQLSGMLNATGKSRAVLSIILTIFFLVGFFIPGTDASLQKGAVLDAVTIGNIDLEL
ncbi:hypothetical protein ACFLZD_01420 [Candidatus Neomarinimicrobiota bacterium]